MASSEIEHEKIDFYEKEYDEAYSEKPSFNAMKPTIAGIILFVSGIPMFLMLIYEFLTYSGSEWVGLIIVGGIFLVITLTIMIAGICAIKKIKHRLALFGTVVTFILPFYSSSVILILYDIFGIQIGGVGTALTFLIMPIFPMYLIITSDDQFTS